MKFREFFILLSFGFFAAVALFYVIWPESLFWLLLIGLPIILLGYYDIFQKKHSIKRNFPVLGNFRYMLESIRPELMQYFVETDTQGRPINRLYRSLIYQRSKKVNDTAPFGTQSDVYDEGYEWMEHSVYAKSYTDLEAHPRVLVGGASCEKPYSASVLNVSAMSFGSLSERAIQALNSGAKKGNFAHNTGEGGISSYHLDYGGDLIWQIGTGYFGCRTIDGDFCPETFKTSALHESVKMIEVKISQGAKPGHGGMLPAIKNTPEIAKIRGIKPHVDVHSPPAHKEFSNAMELMLFIKKLRELSGGKPVGFKLCIGRGEEFIEFCETMVETGIKPDFISIDGGEGGTGAAPVEFSNSLGRPLREGLSFAVNTLEKYDLKKDIKVMASGKVFTAFHMARLMALGADIICSARAMMLALGCIQALECNSNSCPTGVATQNKSLVAGLNVEDKALRVSNFHSATVKALNELLAASGFEKPSQIQRDHIKRRVSMHQTLSYKDIYP